MSSSSSKSEENAASAAAAADLRRGRSKNKMSDRSVNRSPSAGSEDEVPSITLHYPSSPFLSSTIISTGSSSAQTNDSAAATTLSPPQFASRIPTMGGNTLSGSSSSSHRSSPTAPSFTVSSAPLPSSS